MVVDDFKLPEQNREAEQQRCDQNRSGRISACPASGPSNNAIGLGMNWLHAKEAFKVLGQLARGRVASLRVLFKAFEANGLQIARDGRA